MQAKSAEVSAAKRKSREHDFEPTSEDEGVTNRKNVEGARLGSKGSKRRARTDDGPDDSKSRGDDIARLKEGFLVSKTAGGRRENLVTSAQDFVQPKRMKVSKG